MYPLYLTIGLILAVAIIGFVSVQIKKSKAIGKPSPEGLSSSRDKDKAVIFVNTLQHLGYFKFAKVEDLELLHKTMIEAFDPKNELVTIWEDDISATPKDYRYYFCDNEDLFEEGGFTEMLKALQPTFDKIVTLLQR